MVKGKEMDPSCSSGKYTNSKYASSNQQMGPHLKAQLTDPGPLVLSPCNTVPSLATNMQRQLNRETFIASM